jgi:hypothetical protein
VNDSPLTLSEFQRRGGMPPDKTVKNLTTGGETVKIFFRPIRDIGPTTDLEAVPSGILCFLFGPFE